MTRLAPPLKDAHLIVPHLLNCEPRSALERESIRHPSLWRERWAFMLIGAAAIVIPWLLIMWDTKQ